MNLRLSSNMPFYQMVDSGPSIKADHSNMFSYSGAASMPLPLYFCMTWRSLANLVLAFIILFYQSNKNIIIIIFILSLFNLSYQYLLLFHNYINYLFSLFYSSNLLSIINSIFC